MKVKFHPEARLELRKARAWYERRSPLAATAFAHEVADGISRITESPVRWPEYEHGTRRFVLQRFPFSIFYRVGTNEIVVVAVAHHKRDPDYWHQR